MAEPLDPLIGRILNNAFRIESLLADGGMSRVYLAHQISLARTVVIKMLLPGFNDPDFIQLFLREARVNSNLNHPNIVGVFDFGQTEDGLVFLAMEYLEGATLADVVQGQGDGQKGLTLANIVWLMEQLCNAVSAAHQQQVVHRDLKPGNVMVARLAGNTTVVKVVDFGISKPMDEENLKHTQMGAVMGTPGYLAPEQIMGREIDHRADIYGVGAILHFMITGEAPYRAASREIIMNRQLKELPKLLAEYPLRDPACQILQPVIHKAMAIDRDQRYASIQELWQDFVTVSRQEAQLATAGGDAVAVERRLYQFVFRGELQPGATLATVKQKLATAFRFSAQQVDALFSGKRVIVRKKIPLDDANRYADLFTRAGALGHVEEMADLTRILVPPTGASMRPPSLPDAGLAQPISVTGFIRPAVAVGVQPSSPGNTNLQFQHSVGNTGELPGEKRSQPGAVSEAAPAIAPPGAKRRSRRRALWVTMAALMIAIATIYSVPAWRYAVLDPFMYATGLATPQRGVDSRHIRLGMSAAFSGSTRELGRATRVGIEACFHEVNAKGGVHGRKLELEPLDDAYEPQRAKANLAALLDPERGAFALIGNLGTPTARAMLPDLLKNRVLLFGPVSGANLLRKDPPDRYVFNYRASYAEETAAIVHYFVGVLGMQPDNIAVFHQNDSYGRDGLAGVANALLRYNVPIERIQKASYRRNTAQVERAVMELRPHLHALQGIVIVATYPASAEFTRQVRMAGFRGRIANVSFVGSLSLAEQLREVEGDIANGVIVSQVVPMPDAYATGVLEYRAALERHFPGEPAGFGSLEGYIVARLLVHALEREGRYFTVESLVERLEKIRDLDLGIGTTLSFSRSDHQASHRVWGSVINAQGQFEALDFDKVDLTESPADQD